ncbi:MAG: phosphoglycerate kinase [Thermotogae bacterium]|nr:phosphoglycerate kinase [Thermotogota bacterium]
MTKLLTIKDEPEAFKGKSVFVRVDYNVVKNGEIQDTYRIDRTLPTIRFLLEAGAKQVVLASHSGRPKDRDESLSLRPIVQHLSEKLSEEVGFVEDVPNGTAPEDRRVILLENLRFWKGEKDDDPKFAEALSRFGDEYVNDAFGVSHRKNASVSAIAQFYTKRYAGLLLAEEVEKLSEVRDNPDKPFHVLFGGAKVRDKIPVLEALVQKADRIFIGGAMAYTFLKAKGVDVGNSIVDNDRLEWAKEFLNHYKSKVYLPKDHVCATAEVEKCGDGYEVRDTQDERIEDGWIGYDIGWNTIKTWKDALKEANMVFWNGPVGYYECEDFECGTKLLAILLSGFKDDGKKVVVGGGDTVAALSRFSIPYEDFHFVSTGGGAALDFLAGKHLPGLEIITKKEA